MDEPSRAFDGVNAHAQCESFQRKDAPVERHLEAETGAGAKKSSTNTSFSNCVAEMTARMHLIMPNKTAKKNR